MSFHMSLPLDFLLQLILLNLKCFLFGFNPQSFTLFSALSYHLDQSPGLIILRHYLVNKLIRLHLSFYEAPKKKRNKQCSHCLWGLVCLCAVCLLSSVSWSFWSWAVWHEGIDVAIRHLFITQTAGVLLQRGKVIGREPQRTLCACVNTYTLVEHTVLVSFCLRKTWMHTNMHGLTCGN